MKNVFYQDVAFVIVKVRAESSEIFYHLFNYVPNLASKQCYSSVCQLPVAKRNFVKRHGHGMVNNSKELRETIDRLHPCRVPTKLNPEQDIDESTQSTIGNLVFQLSESIHDVSASESEDEFEEYDSLSSGACSDDRLVESTTEPLIGINQVTFSRQLSSEVKSQESSKRIYSTFSISSTVVTPVYEPVPNPLSTPVSIDVPHVIPASPEVVSCPSDITSIDDILDLPRCLSKSVPLVEPGIRITEDQFADAIKGIDFAKVFD